jgi:dTDP-4-amino-4,6-dideoxygalactose transaminase
LPSILQRRKIPMLDLAALHLPLRDEVLAAITRVVDSQQFILGPDVGELERSIAAYCGVEFAIACASGSDALLMALLAVGIRPGDRVLTTPYTFFATAGAITLAGAIPVFADIDPTTYNIDPARVLHVLESTRSIKAVIPVHLFGGCADMDPLLEAARTHHCPVIEDGAQSIGAEYQGRRAQSMGNMACLSFFPSKNLGAFGDGGMLLTSDPQCASLLRSLRMHGSTRKYYHETIGTNSRLDTLQAAILNVKFKYLDSWTSGRQRNAALYRRLLAESGAPVTPPVEAPYQTRHIYNQFVIRAPRRDALKGWLADHGVSTEIYYPVPLHLQPCYRDLGYQEDAFPESEKAASETLALPVHSALSDQDVEYIAGLIADFYRQRG